MALQGNINNQYCTECKNINKLFELYAYIKIGLKYDSHIEGYEENLNFTEFNLVVA